jgi:hypothetical protein
VTHKLSFSITRFVLGKVLLAGMAVSFLGPASGHASLILSVQSATVAAGSSGNGFDVQLSNSGPSAVTIAGFSFGILTANTNISFRDANISTSAPYIFGSNSLFGPDLTGPTSGQSLSTSDIFAIPLAGATLGAGITVGLGHVLFDVSPAAAVGTSLVTLAGFPVSSLSDAAGNNVVIQTLSSGQITITGTGVPEPSTLATVLAGIALILGHGGRWRKGQVILERKRRPNVDG